MADISSVVTVNISIDSPVSDGASFSNILLVTPVGTGTGTTNACYSISAASELLERGYAATDPVYLAATVAFAQDQVARPSAVYVVGYNVASESITDALERAEAYGGWYGVCPVGIVGVGGDQATPEDIEADRRAKLASIATWVESKDHICGIAYTDEAPLTFTNYSRTFGIYAGDTEVENALNEYAAVAWMGNCFGDAPGSETWALKSLNLISPSKLTSSEATALKNDGVNYYHTIANSDVTIDGYMGGGEWIDTIRFRDWLKNEIQVAAFNYLKVNRKIAYTNAGITGIQNVITRVLREGQNIGGIAENQYDNDGNSIPGYTITVPNAVDIPDTVKKSRKLYDVRFTARLSGAIHAIEIRGSLVY